MQLLGKIFLFCAAAYLFFELAELGKAAQVVWLSVCWLFYMLLQLAEKVEVLHKQVSHLISKVYHGDGDSPN